MDPFQGLADFVLGKLKQSAAALWFKFLFEMAFSAFGSFLFVCGTMLVTTRVVTFSVGSGMIAAAISMTVLFRKEASRLTKGMLVVLPADEAAKEMAANLQSIQKPPQEKKL
jgi:hypothetical protein